jgi:DNA-binding transcriptional regulator LsrR (DeoR family)
MAQAAVGGNFTHYVKKLNIVGEINNQVFDEVGTDRTKEVPALSKYMVNVLSLSDIRSMAGNYPRHKIVMVASGPEKTRAMRVALEAGFANVLISGRDDADRLLNS